MFPDFERIIDKNMFNMEVLNKHCDELTKQLLKLFEKKPDAIECFQGEYVCSGREWNSGECWHVSMTESIRYSEGIYWDNMIVLGSFSPDLSCPDIELSDIKK